MKKMIITWEDALTAWREHGVQAVPSRMLEVLIKEAQDRLEVIYAERMARQLILRINDALAESTIQSMNITDFENDVEQLLLWHEYNKPNDSTEDEAPDPADMADHANDVAGDR